MRFLARSAVAAAAILSMVLAIAAPAESAQARFAKGDLAEYVTGLGPTVGEVINGPYASNYCPLSVQEAGQVPISCTKLRLLPRAGTPNAPFNAGHAVSWTPMDTRETGAVERVKGAWAQVKSVSATTIGWIACEALRPANQAAKAPGSAAPNGAQRATPQPDAAGTAASAGAGPDLTGEWENADGSVKVEFQGRGKCCISMGPMSSPCTAPMRRTARRQWCASKTRTWNSPPMTTGL